MPKVGVNVFPGHDGRVTSHKKIICKSYQRFRGGNRDFFSHFSMIFEITSKFHIVFVKLMIDKVGVDGFTRPRQETDIRYEFSLKVTLKGLGYKNRFFQPFLNEFPSRF